MSEQEQQIHEEFGGGTRYDCIVVGAGHAGCEAALVACPRETPGYSTVIPETR
jgi:flavin-dependent dehydrogenase